MPEYPDTVRVRLGTKIVEYVVAGLKECPACGRTIFFALTGNKYPDGKPKTMPVDAEAQADGVRVAHFVTCTNPGRFRRPSRGDRTR